MDQKQHFRLVTRRNFDGLACAALLKEQDLIYKIVFAHPKEIQDGAITITNQDILANLPPDPQAHLVFNHHHAPRNGADSEPLGNVICNPKAPSTARVIYQHYGAEKGFPRISAVMISAVDQGNTARFSQQEILKPQGWVLFNFLMDPRTGVGRFRHFRFSNHGLIMLLIDLCRVQEIEQIMELPDVQERVEVYFKHHEKFLQQIARCTTAQDHLVILDQRQEEVIWAGNRFVVYALYPKCNISVQVTWGPDKKYTVFSIGKSIVNRTSNLDIGKLAHKYGGGGHQNAGTCRVDNSQTKTVLEQLVAEINQGE